LVTFQAAAPPAGLLVVTALPLLSIATHRPLLGHDTPTRLIPATDAGSSICIGAAQVNSEPAAVVGDGVGVAAIEVGVALGG
jgi:hypothetical protein